MIESVNLDYKSLQQEAQHISGQTTLRQYGLFLEKYTEQLIKIEDKFKFSKYNDPMYHPISIKSEVFENKSVLQLVSSDNRLLSKTLASFTAICEESFNLLEESKNKYYNKLLIYNISIQDDNAIIESSNDFLELLQDIRCSIKQCYHLITLLVQHLVTVSSKELGTLHGIAYMHFVDAMEHLADLLLHAVILDSLLNNQNIQNRWNGLKKMFKMIHHNHKQFKLPLQELSFLNNIILQTETALLSDMIFQNVLEHCTVEKSSGLSEEINKYMQNTVIDIIQVHQDGGATNYKNWLRVNILFVYNFRMFGICDKKFFKNLTDVNKKLSTCTLVGNILWYPEKFFTRHIPTLVNSLDETYVQSITSFRKSLISQKTINIQKETLLVSQQVYVWITQIESIVQEDMSKLKVNDLQLRCRLLMQGFTYTQQIEDTVKRTLNIYVAQSMPISKKVLMSLFRLIELLKGICYIFKKHSVSLVHCITIVCRYLLFQILNLIKTTKEGLKQNKSYNSNNIDVLSALCIAEQTLCGPCSKQRLLIARLALSATATLPDRIFNQFRTKLLDLEIIRNVQDQLLQYCDESFLYWHQAFVPIYFQNIFNYKLDATRMPYLLYGLNDCTDFFTKDKIELFESDILNIMNDVLIQPLCQSVEINLRLDTHAHLQTNKSSPFQTPVPDTRLILAMQPLRLMNRALSIKLNVEHYLSNTFYNLATVVSHDWQTYGEMRQLAYFKHNLETVEDNLPNQSLEQGLDVLEIMRNIHNFVSQYLYNLNNQIFVQQCSNNKHLNTINIRHIANSIRVHGKGIMNTTVNFTYQFLRKKFYIFSQFLFDEHIKSRLIKDLKYFRENKNVLDQLYPFERADKFNRAIRNLGITAGGQSYLDLFRMLISHIGNAMGYVRMIRSGGRHSCADATWFLPDLEVTDMFSSGEAEGSFKNTSTAAERLHKDISTLVDNFEEKTEYFKLLVEVFAPTFRDASNMHLRNFYMIIPPLTINYVEYSLSCKDRLSKKNKQGASFTDDGFVMGLAYILQLLEQNSEFNSLHWFQSVCNKYQKDLQKMKDQLSDMNQNDAKLSQTQALTEKRVFKYQQEFDLLEYSLSSASIFFYK